ncbi:apolipoprotein D-like [Tetranychus urticae]|nr:apolipoprotein D-like [Tetranychus urticae]
MILNTYASVNQQFSLQTFNFLICAKTMKMIATLFVVFAVASSAFGQCPVPTPVSGADIGKIAGRWYEISGSTLDLTCVTMDFTPREDGNFNYTTLGSKSDGSKHSRHLLAIRTDNENSFNISDMSTETRYPITFYIADTDYDNYLAMYSCVFLPGSSGLFSGSILSRANSMDDEKHAELFDLLINKVGLTADKIQPITQEYCKY